MSQVTPELLAEIQALIQQGQIGGDGRSPMRPRQLDDLRLQPTATDPRPLFIPSAESPRHPTGERPPYRRLMWTSDGIELTVTSEAEFRQKLDDGYLDRCPASVVIDPVQDVTDALADLTEAERQMVLDAQRQSRLQALQAKLAALPEEQLLALLSGEPIKRKPGRPKKVSA